MIFASKSAVSGVVSAGLSTQVLPQASAGASFHAAISSGKFHGMTCRRRRAASGVAPGKAYLELVGPARVVEEVGAASGTSTSRDSLIGLPPSIVSTIASSRDFSWMRARDAVDVLAAVDRPQLAPVLLIGVARGRDRAIHVALVGLGDLGELLLGRGADGVEVPTRLGSHPLPADEQLVARVDLDVVGGLRRRRVRPRGAEIEGRRARRRAPSRQDAGSSGRRGRRGRSPSGKPRACPAPRARRDTALSAR
jgi:hypothetical protein